MYPSYIVKHLKGGQLAEVPEYELKVPDRIVQTQEWSGING
jgi:hypothetical protein